MLNADLQNEDHLVWAEISPKARDLPGLGNLIVSLTDLMRIGKHLSLAFRKCVESPLTSPNLHF